MKLRKKYKPLIAALIALILVGAAYALVVLLAPEDVPEEKHDASEGYTTLVKYELKDLDHVDFSFPDGYQYTIKLTHKSDSYRTYSVVGKEEYDFNYTNISSACLSLSGISSSRVVEENASDLSKYGFDKPQAEVTIYGTDGTSHKVILGADVGVGGYSYAIADDKNDVCLLSEYTTRYLLNKDFAYREKGVLTLDEEDPSSSVKSMSVSNHGEEQFNYRVLSETEMKALDSDIDTSLYMTVPVEHSVNGSTLNDYLLSNLISVSFDDVVEDAPADLAKYGLTDDVMVLSINLTDGTSVNLTLSQPTEDGIRYGIIGGVNSVVTFGSEDFDFLDNFDFSSLIYRLIWTYNIQQLAGFDVIAHGEKHSVELFDPTDDEKEEGKTFWAKFDGRELREENCRRLYLRVLSPFVYNMTDEEMEASAEKEPEWSCVIHFDTGRSDETISFHKINARNYAAYRNGEPTGFYVNILDLQAIDEGLELIAKNDLIPDN